ncbi:MAG: 50S ribosomal protein L29 [Bacilli bacterium]|nr:50S ribosomal protein L29 [Bacilli bacterium]
MEINELRKMSNEDLAKKIVEKKEELFAKRMQQSSGSLEKPAQLRTLRREIARMKTILKEREMDGEK